LNLLSDAKGISEWFEFTKDSRCLCILPLFHNNGQITTLLAPLYAGASTIIIKGKISLYAFWFLVNEYQATWTSVMASILSMLLSLPNERKDNSLTAILCGGQILTRSVQEQFEKRFKVPIFEGYGLTETTSFSCINNYPAESRKIGSIGKPLQINEMSILDEDSQEVKENIEGEICIRGYNVASGYLGDTKTNHAFRNGWFHSGDYGRRDGDGNFYFHGRKDSLIIKGGENVYPAELENVLYNHPDIDECAVIGIPDELLGENICAFVKIKGKAQLTENDLKKFCKNKITSYKQPKKIIIINNLVDLNEIPKGPTKKILYRKLKEYYRNSF
jgi:acyl-CoA synthetase (AMP-forming)/AMP-acid ligase II